MAVERRLGSFHLIMVASTMLAVAGCGGNNSPGDLVGDVADVVSVVDTGTDEGIPVDVQLRDVVDAAADVVDVDAAADIRPDDANADLLDDGVTYDVPCVPDCSGGECSDDGCGGDCCADGMVCETSWTGEGQVCLPVAGQGCAEVFECLNGCGVTECAVACYEKGSAIARAALLAYVRCIDETCPTGETPCIEQASGPGGACYDEMQVCQTDCPPDCTGGPCTPDGCGGDCCAPEGSCEEPFGGGALNCLQLTGTTCSDIVECINNCANDGCTVECLNSGSMSARASFRDLWGCITGNCPEMDEQCLTTVQSPGGACYESLNACIAN